MERQHDIWPDTGSNVTRVFQVINTDDACGENWNLPSTSSVSRAFLKIIPVPSYHQEVNSSFGQCYFIFPPRF